MVKIKKIDYIFAVGRRKTAVVRVRLHKGSGESVVNSMPIATYFKGEGTESIWNEPFELAGKKGKYWVSIKAAGGGKKAQLDAVIMGISRTLVIDNPESRIELKKRGFLRRDSRTRERRKVGTGGKARRKKQSPKR